MGAAGQVGFECVLTAGGVTIGRAQNVQGPNASASAVDVTTRASVGWKEHKQGLKEWDLDIEQLFVAADTGLQALRSAFLLGTEVAIVAKDSGGNGFSGSAILTKMGFGQPLDGAVSFPIGMKGTGALTVLGAGS